jgi:transposase
MGRKVTPLELSVDERKELEEALRRTDSIKYARRCKIILLKGASISPSNTSIAEEVGVQLVTVAKWVSRYREDGLSGLESKPIPGRPSIFDPVRDAAMVKEQVKKSRQRLSLAHAAIEEAKGKKMNVDTLRRFLKNLAHDSTDYV